MYVCICNAVTESQLLELIYKEGLTDLESVKSRIKVADQCGVCEAPLAEKVGTDLISRLRQGQYLYGACAITKNHLKAHQETNDRWK